MYRLLLVKHDMLEKDYMTWCHNSINFDTSRWMNDDSGISVFSVRVAGSQRIAFKRLDGYSFAGSPIRMYKLLCTDCCF